MNAARGGASGLWARFRSSYTEGVWLLFVTVLMATVYFGATTMLPPLMFLAGLLLLGHLDPRRGKAIRHFLAPAGLSGAILIMAFFRSDFVEMILAGKSIGVAYAKSTRYFQAPMVMWFTTWALVCAAWNLREDGSRRLITWLGWLLLALTCIEFFDAASGDGLRNAMNRAWFHGLRPEMVIVDASNLNAVLLMLFWPMAFWFMHKRWLVAVQGMALVILWDAVTVDTNAHILALFVGYVVFLCTRYWPNAWSRAGRLPERELAGLATFWVLAFPLIIILLVRSGLSRPLHDHLPASWAARIDIWSYAIERSLQKPWFGWGYESARRFVPYIPDHTHNMSLQAWLELGIPGLILLAVFWFSVFWVIAPRKSVGFERLPDNGLIEIDSPDAVRAADIPIEQQARPYMLAAAATYFLLNAISYGMWRAWLYCLGALMVAVGAMVIKAVKADGKLRNKL